MVRKPRKRGKHIPQRTCVGCRSILEKRALIRVVRTSQGVLVDLAGKQAGRGAYLHKQRSCWEYGVQNGLARALRTSLTATDKLHLLEFARTLPQENSETFQDV